MIYLFINLSLPVSKTVNGRFYTTDAFSDYTNKQFVFRLVLCLRYTDTDGYKMHCVSRPTSTFRSGSFKTYYEG